MADCNWITNPGGCISEGVGSIVSAAANDTLRELVNQVMEGWGKALASLGSLWVVVPTPILTGGNGAATTEVPPLSENFTMILSYVTWFALTICVLSLVGLGAMIGIRHRRGEGEAQLGRLGIVLVAVLLISGASAGLSALLPTVAPGDSSSTVTFLQNSLWYYVGGLAILSVIVGGVKMAWDQRAQPGKELLQSLLTLVVVSGAGLTVIALGVSAADAFSAWVLNSSTDCDVTVAPADGESTCFGTTVGTLVGLASGSPIGLIGVLVLGSLALLMTYVQVALMVIRGGMLVILAGVLPIAASFTNTEMGRSWFKKTIGWTIAFILYKPAAALIYAAAFQLAGADVFRADGGGIWDILTGLALMLIALLALPALLRFVAPMTAAIGGGGTAALAMGAAGVAVGGDLASGAIRRASAGGGPSAASGPSSTPAGASSSGGGIGRSPSPVSGTAAPSTGATASGGGATAGTAAAAGPVGAGVAMAGQVAQKTKEVGQAAAGALRSAAEESAGPTGAHEERRGP